jgi:hypothetical protein
VTAGSPPLPNPALRATAQARRVGKMPAGKAAEKQQQESCIL